MKLSPSGESAMERVHSDALHEQKEMGWNRPRCVPQPGAHIVPPVRTAMRDAPWSIPPHFFLLVQSVRVDTFHCAFAGRRKLHIHSSTLPFPAASQACVWGIWGGAWRQKPHAALRFRGKRENCAWSRPPSLAAARQFTLSAPAFFLILRNRYAGFRRRCEDVSAFILTSVRRASPRRVRRRCAARR